MWKQISEPQLVRLFQAKMMGFLDTESTKLQTKHSCVLMPFLWNLILKAKLLFQSTLANWKSKLAHSSSNFHKKIVYL